MFRPNPFLGEMNMFPMIPPQIPVNHNKQSKRLIKSAKNISFQEIYSILEKIANITDTVLFKPSYQSVSNEFTEYQNILRDKLAFVKEENLAIRHEEMKALHAAQELIIILNKRFEALSARSIKPVSETITKPSYNNSTEYKSGPSLFNVNVTVIDLLKLTLKFIDFNQRFVLCRINKITYKNLPLDIQCDNLSKINILTLGCYFIILENNAIWKNSTYGQLIEIHHLAQDKDKTNNSSFFRNKLKSLEDKPDNNKKEKKKSFCVIS